MSDIETVLAEQARYYRARASEYDDWWFRRGRYDHGPEANARWFADVAMLEAALETFAPRGNVLELACGTGLWTRSLAGHARRVTAFDASAEMLELAAARAGDAGVRYVQGDVFSWQPEESYDACFFGFWLSHVPEELFERFWEQVKRALGPGGRAFFIDSLRNDISSAVDRMPQDESAQTMTRRLADGREFLIVKRFYEPQALERRLADLGWSAEVHTTPEFFLYGQASTPGPPP